MGNYENSYNSVYSISLDIPRPGPISLREYWLAVHKHRIMILLICTNVLTGYLAFSDVWHFYSHEAKTIFASMFEKPIAVTLKDKLPLITKIDTRPPGNAYRGRYFNFEKNPGSKRVMFFGGSNVFDRGSENGDDWPTRMEGTLKDALKSDKLEIINTGTGGEASFEALEKLYLEGHLFKPDVVVLVASSNDFRFFASAKSVLQLTKNGGFRNNKPSTTIDTQTTFNQYQIILDMFVDVAHSIGAIPVLVNQPHHLSDKQTTQQQAEIMRYYGNSSFKADTLLTIYQHISDRLKKTAKRKKAIFIDVSTPMSGISTYFSDHLHLASDGREKMIELIAPKIQPLLVRR